MKEKLFFFSIKHPLSLILLVAIIVKVLAVIFTDGWLTGINFNYYHIPSWWMANPWIVYISRLALGAFSLLIITIAYRITKSLPIRPRLWRLPLLELCFGVCHL